jgi:hypothetical protein
MAATALTNPNGPSGPVRLAQEDPDYLEWQGKAQLADLAQEEWEQGNDSLWSQRAALQIETARLRETNEDRQLAREEQARVSTKNAGGFMELFEDWAKGGHRARTVAAYRGSAQHFQARFGKADAHTITRDDVLDAWSRGLMVRADVGGALPAPPLGDQLRVDPMPLRKCPRAFLTILNCSTDCRCRDCAPVKNLAHSASFHSCMDNAPSNSVTKHLGYLNVLLDKYKASAAKRAARRQTSKLRKPKWLHHNFR